MNSMSKLKRFFGSLLFSSLMLISSHVFAAQQPVDFINRQSFPAFVPSGGMSSLSYTIHNYTSKTLNLKSITANVTAGSIVRNSSGPLDCGTTIAAGANCTLSFTFTGPSSAATPITGTVSIDYGWRYPLEDDQLRFILPSGIASVSPTQGPCTGGTSVVVIGSNFYSVSAVEFGSNAVSSYHVDSSTQITAVTPPSGNCSANSVVPIKVTTPSGTTTSANLFTYISKPTVTSVGTQPVRGPVAGGTSVTITGTNFYNVTQVKFGSTNAATFTVNSPTQITAVSPAGSAGTVDVTVTSLSGTSATSSSDEFIYMAAPTITTFTPIAGPLAGGTSVTITGSNFYNVSSVKFGSTAASSFTVNSTSSITATSPAGTGAVGVTVTTPSGTVTSSSSFTYANTPTIASVTPSQGKIDGTQSVVIVGTNFVGSTSQLSVKFGSASAAHLNLDSASQITVSSPIPTCTDASSGACLTNTPVDVTVTAAGGSAVKSSGFTYIPLPVVNSVSPFKGYTTGGTGVTINGANFTGATAVYFGAGQLTSSSFSVNTAGNQITVPHNPSCAEANGGTCTTALPFYISVETSGGKGTSSSPLFTYVPPPTVTEVTPSGGNVSGGDSVTITGTFFQSGGDNIVTRVQFGSVDLTPYSGTCAFGNPPAGEYCVSDSGTIYAKTPAGTGIVDIHVTTTLNGVNATSAQNVGDEFAYGNVPRVISVSPTQGLTNTANAVTITGKRFTGVTATGVSFGSVQLSESGSPCADGSGLTTGQFCFSNDTTIYAKTTSVGTAGTVDVTVTTVDGISATSLADQFTYYPVIPVVSSVSPSVGTTSGGTTVTITGPGAAQSSFTGADAVYFGSTVASSFTVVSPSEIQVVSPAHVAGTVDVKVHLPSGAISTVTSDSQRYTYQQQLTSQPSLVLFSNQPGTISAPGRGSLRITNSSYGSSVGQIAIRKKGTANPFVTSGAITGTDLSISSNGCATGLAQNASCEINFTTSDITADASSVASLDIIIPNPNVSPGLPYVSNTLSDPIAHLSVFPMSPPLQTQTDGTQMLLVAGCAQPEVIEVVNNSNSSINVSNILNPSTSGTISGITVNNYCSVSGGLAQNGVCMITLLPAGVQPNSTPGIVDLTDSTGEHIEIKAKVEAVNTTPYSPAPYQFQGDQIFYPAQGQTDSNHCNIVSVVGHFFPPTHLGGSVPQTFNYGIGGGITYPDGTSAGLGDSDSLQGQTNTISLLAYDLTNAFNGVGTLTFWNQDASGSCMAYTETSGGVKSTNWYLPSSGELAAYIGLSPVGSGHWTSTRFTPTAITESVGTCADGSVGCGYGRGGPFNVPYCARSFIN